MNYGITGTEMVKLGTMPVSEGRPDLTVKDALMEQTEFLREAVNAAGDILSFISGEPQANRDVPKYEGMAGHAAANAEMARCLCGVLREVRDLLGADR